MHPRSHKPPRVHERAAVVLFALVCCACQLPEMSERGGHGSGEAHAPHDEAVMLSVTHFTEKTELFVEFPPMVVGERSAFAAHLTRLRDFAPIDAGSVSIELLGSAPKPETFTVIKPTQPGIFRPVVIPTIAGTYQAHLRWTFEDQEDLHDLGEWRVYADADAAKAASGGDEAGEITLLKEQQWFLDFATAPVAQKTLRPTEPLYGALTPRPGGILTLPAPVAGQLTPPPRGWPQVGAEIEAGQVLAVITPRLEESGADLASLNAAVQQARIELQHDQSNVKRLERLFNQGVIPERRLIEARGDVAHARVSLQAAQQRLRLRQRGQGTQGNHYEVEVRAPFAGTIRDTSSAPGTFVEGGAALFEIAEDQVLWLEVRVPERLLSALTEELEGWFELSGDPHRHTLRADQRIPGLTPVDPATRTAALRFEISADSPLPVGAHTRVHLFLERPAEVVAIPRDAVINDGGQDIVFVMRSGESFNRRPVRLGVRDGDFVEVKAGLTPGERVVTRGAYIVKLAASSNQVPSHGHAH